MSMSKERLHVAADLLKQAAERTDDEAASGRLTGLAGQLDSLAESGRGPDHGRLARIENALDEVSASVDDETADIIERAHDEVVRYRETVPGV
jgi:hypothetical protein